MFNKIIADLNPFTNKDVFSNVGGTSYDGDVVLKSVLCMLLHDRGIDRKYTVDENIMNSNLEYIKENINQEDSFIESTFKELYNGIVVQSFDNISNMQFNKIMQVIEPKMIEMDYKNLGDVDKFISKFSDVVCKTYTSEKYNAVAIFISNKSILPRRLYASLMYRLLPQLAKNDKLIYEGRKDKEREVLKSLTKKKSSDFLNAISVIIESDDIRQKTANDLVLNLTKRIAEKQLKEAEQKIREIRHEIDTLNNQYVEKLRELQNENDRFYGIQQRASGGGKDEEFADFVARNKNIHIEGITNDFMKITVTTDLNNFDVDMFDSYMRSGSLNMLKDNPNYPRYLREDPDRVFNLLKKIFCENPMFKIRIAQCYNLNFVTGYVNVNRYTSPDHVYLETRMRNPHIERHACLGNHSRYINQALRKGDMINAINQCIASAGSVNIAQNGITFMPFVINVLSTGRKVLYNVETGELMSAEEAAKSIEVNE